MSKKKAEAPEADESKEAKKTPAELLADLRTELEGEALSPNSHIAANAKRLLVIVNAL